MVLTLRINEFKLNSQASTSVQVSAPFLGLHRIKSMMKNFVIKWLKRSGPVVFVLK